MRTHRCKELLEYNKSQFRKVRIKYDTILDDTGWWLNHLVWDYDWDYVGMEDVCIITHCPFCGEKLEVE